MYPDLLGIFGVSLYGTVFERILWSVLAALMVWGIVSSVIMLVKGNKTEGAVQGLITGGLFFFFVNQAYQAFQPGYVLFFNEPVVLHTYALMILIGIGAGVWTVMKMAPFRGIDPKTMMRLCIYLVVFGFIGARAAHVIVEWQTYWNSCFDPAAAGLSERSCLRALNVAEGGLTFYGGVIAGFFVLIAFYFRHRKENISMLSVGDLLAPPLAVAHAFGRIGCLAAGCCWGAVSTGSFGVRYGADSFAFAELAKNPLYSSQIMHDGLTPVVHATQLYESSVEFLLYGFMWLMLIKGAKKGRIFSVWFIFYGIARFIIEAMRDDTERGSFVDKAMPQINEILHVPADHYTILSTSQGIAIMMIGIGIIAFIASFRKTESTSESKTAADSASPAA